MGSHASPHRSSTDGVDRPTLPQRLAELEQRCAEMWSDALEPLGERVPQYERLAELDRRIAGIRLRCIARPDESALERDAAACAHDLAQLSERWTTPHAA